MNKSETFSILKGPWDAIGGFDIVKITDDFQGLQVWVQQERSDCQGIFYFDAAYGYRHFEEGDVHMRWANVDEAIGNSVIIGTDTDFMRWAEKAAISGKLPKEVKHYVIFSINHVLEVLAYNSPHFILFKDKNKI